MKRDRSNQKLTKGDFEKFEYHDTRYYGLFYTKTETGINVNSIQNVLKIQLVVSFLMYKLKSLMQDRHTIFTQRKASIMIIVAMCLWIEFRRFETIGKNIIKNL